MAPKGINPGMGKCKVPDNRKTESIVIPKNNWLKKTTENRSHIRFLQI